MEYDLLCTDLKKLRTMTSVGSGRDTEAAKCPEGGGGRCMENREAVKGFVRDKSPHLASSGQNVDDRVLSGLRSALAGQSVQ